MQGDVLPVDGDRVAGAYADLQYNRGYYSGKQPSEEHLWLRVDFADCDYNITTWLRYDGAKWSLRQHAGENVLHVYNRGRNSFYSTAVDADIKADRFGQLKRISIQAGSVTRSSLWKSQDGLVTTLTIDLQLGSVGYMGQNVTTKMEIDEVKHMDTRQWIRSVPDDILEGLTATPGLSMPRLVQALTSQMDDDLMKVKVLHDWLAENAYYDLPCHAAYKAQQSLSSCALDHHSVLSRRKVTCGPLVAVFRRMCALAGVHIRMLHGTSVCGPGTHTFGAILINDAWRFIDLTANTRNRWDGETSTQAPFTTRQLFVEPEYFASAYKCDEARYQFLDDTGPESPSNNDLLAVGSLFSAVNVNFYDAGLKLVKPRSLKTVNPVGDGSWQMVIDKPEDLDVLLTLVHLDGAWRRVAGQVTKTNTGNRLGIDVSPARPGYYRLGVWTDKKTLVLEALLHKE